jgi:hypothetical protein
MTAAGIPPSTEQGQAGPRLGVIEAMSRGWALATGDFWMLWAAAFLAWALPAVAGPGAIVVGPPMAAGLFYVLALRMQGRPVRVGQVFEGFTQRFKPSVIAGLVPYGAHLAAGIIWVPIHIVLVFTAVGLSEAVDQREPPWLMFPVLLIDFAIIGVLVLAAMAVRMFFIFAQCAVWDMPESGWSAAKFSVRTVRDHLWPVLGLWGLFALVGMCGALLGYICGCGLGLFFTMPMVDLWYSSSVLHLYRSWTGKEVVAST